MAEIEVSDPLVWIDLEMTGLDPERDVILEIAVVVTDGQLEQVIEGPDLVLRATTQALEGMIDIVTEMHRDSGLIEEVRRSTVTVAAAQNEALAFVKEHVPEAGVAPLAGNSIHTDRAFLQRNMPELETWMHYRNVDVSTIKELAARWYPQIIDRAPPKAGGHRARQDILESIEELRFYRSEAFR